MSLKKKALSGVFWTFLQQFSTQGIAFVVSVILARLLLPEEFGLIAMISVFMGIGTILMNAGLGSSLIRSKNPNQEDYSTVFFFNLGGSVVIYAIIFAIAPYIANFYNQDILTNIVRWYAITFIINAFSMIQLTRLTKLMDFKTQMIVAVPSLIVSGGVGIYMAYSGYGVWSLVGQILTQSIVSTLQLWYWSKWTPSWVFSKEKFIYHFNFGYKLTLSGILDTIFTNAYAIIIGKFFPIAKVGYYQRANSLQLFPVGSISAVIGKVSYPLFAKIQDDDVQLKSVYKKIMQMIVFIVAPTLIVLGVLAEPLFRFLFTEKWLPAVPYFQILIFTGILYPIHAYNLNILNVKGRSDLFLKLEVIKKTITIIVIVIAFQFGIYGLLYGSVLVSLLAFFVNTYYSGKFINYSTFEQVKDILPILALALITGILVYGIDYAVIKLFKYDLVRLLIGGFMAFVFYIPLSYLFKLNSLTELINIIKKL
ncbi:capsule biosynthesis protein CapK [Lutibacter profundi]|uniref:Capsule biosynthesis protein CapK n=1 Tax=Lutibacter profundi TaxID=1622118 RepID=A0A0X8G6B7_9FLAO|nr:lipopolysaccharide biosynthesis protein [Lutibacter profundi]AMC10866.1 capsule biosynthesis protein CapK [Lutibacter profundi]